VPKFGGLGVGSSIGYIHSSLVTFSAIHIENLEVKNQIAYGIVKTVLYSRDASCITSLYWFY